MSCWKTARAPGWWRATWPSTGRRWRCCRRTSAPTASPPSASNWRGCRWPSTRAEQERRRPRCRFRSTSEQIDLPEIALGQQLAGSGIAELAAKGSAKADASPLAIETVLNVTRHDGKQGNVDAKIHFAPDENKLDLDLKASEPAGGIIANLLKLPGAPPVDIVVSGTGPLANWSGVGTFTVDGQIVTQLDRPASAHRQGQPRSRPRATASSQRFLPERSASRCLPARPVSISPAPRPRPAASTSSAPAIESDAVHGTAAGMVDPKGASDLSVELAAKGRAGRGQCRHPGTADHGGHQQCHRPRLRRRQGADDRRRRFAGLGGGGRLAGEQSGCADPFRRLRHREPQRPGQLSS